jgi:GGDEF domain-containing protein
MPPVPPRRRRARPVADAPIDALLPRTEDLAKGWLLALLEQAPLDEAPAILATELTRDGPRVCDGALRALADDTDLRQLEPGGVLEPLAARVGELAGAASPAAVSRAVDALQAVLWSAVREELRAPDADLISALSERLALIGELVRAAALDRVVGDGRRAAVPVAEASPPPPAPERPPMAPPPPVASSRPPAQPAPSPEPQRAWPGLSDGPPPSPAALWIGALEDEIARSGGSRLSLLLAELEDADRVSAVEAHPEARSTFGRFAGAVRSATRRQDILVCESEARAWIIARETDRQGARALGERIASAVREAPSWRGAPLMASIGVAVLGEDGRTTAELIEAAEEARFAAAAGGVEILSGDEP